MGAWNRRGCRQNRGSDGMAMASLGKLWRPLESRTYDGRAVPTTGEPCRRRESRADDGRAVPTTGEAYYDGRGLRTVVMCAQTCLGPWDSRNVAEMDVASLGWTWRRRDGRGVAGMDVASPGWTWRRRDGRGVPGMDVAYSE